MESNLIDLCAEPASRVQSAAFYALKELAPGHSVVLVTAREPSLMMQSLDLQLGHKLAWTITEEGARWRVIVLHRADAPPRDVFDLLQREHQRLDALLAQALRLLNEGDAAAASPVLVDFARSLTRHLYIEDELLTPFFSESAAREEPVAMMVLEHAELMAQLELVEDCLQQTTAGAGEVSAFCAILSGTLAKHEYREEHNVFPLWRAAWARKSEQEQKQMMTRVEAALGRATNDERC